MPNQPPPVALVAIDAPKRVKPSNYPEPFASQMQVQEILEPVTPAGTCRACLSLSSGNQEDYGTAQTAQRLTLDLAKEPTSLLQKLELTSLSPSIPYLA